ncbi:nucleoside-diphosphate sugar epimerase/dehydratase [Salibacter sp.]|uniref:nucleoside-diphosphate sugar epimerase/dehydratase n=1 Tax=Salibacter sp. TaxID=2010995 RepID=UPI00287019AB|nr:nucleoside-diphosphate sugar epimerase/dehydratase [Salibacter sp.]MDR9397898.1 nucleoside-diphosphate sugar epimerase/dehydratase [Salibacter sp.]MDR9486580.1 nucleoside-diphosphate sugar epimerase/dehydratase [Salibacter sp.]
MNILREDKNAPRWIILIIDLGIALFSIVTAYFLRFNFSIPDTEFNYLPVSVAFALTTRAFSFYLFKTYAGIIRHSGFNDFQRIFFASILSTLIMAAGNVVLFYIESQYLIPFSIIVIDFLLTFFLMGAMRVSVKLLYRELVRTSTEQIPVVIFGAGESGLMTKRALDRLKEQNYNILAFVDDNPSKISKRLEGTLIIDGYELENFFKKNKVEELIIAVQSLDRKRKSEIVECALNHRVKVLNVPPVTDWINGEINVQQIKNVRIEDLLGRRPIRLDQDEISAELRDKRVLITGAAGSIGSGLVRQVARFYPEKILMLDQAESPLYEVDLEISENYGKGIGHVLIGDIRCYDRIRAIFEEFKPEVVFHAAAYKHVPLMESAPVEAIQTNILGTANLVDLSDEYGVEKFVMISTDKAVNPTNVMGASKRIAEMYAQAKNEVANKTKYITTRFGNVLGSNGSVIPIFRKQIEKGGPITVTHPEITRFFMTIPEACQLVLEAGMMGNGGEIYIFDMGEPVKIVDLAKKMIKLSGLEANKDIEIKFSGLRPGEKLYEELLANEENTVNTHHPQIMIAQVRPQDIESITSRLKELESKSGNSTPVELVRIMKDLVPEFISKNSEFAKLDNQKV